MTVLAPAEAAPAPVEPAPASRCVVCREPSTTVECRTCFIAADRQYERSLDV